MKIAKNVALSAPKYLVGIEVRTKNADEMSGYGKIGKLWEQFFALNIPAVVKERLSEKIYGVYSNYASDQNGEYDYFIGFEVKDASPYTNQSNILVKEVKTGTYSIVTTERGVLQKVIVDAWGKIWTASPEQLGGTRAYNTDFEIYPGLAGDPNDAVVDIYLGMTGR